MTDDMKRHPRNEGFSLIELSIAVLVVGLIMVPLMDQYRAYRAHKAIMDTWGSRTLIASAIGDYYIANTSYPCPADPTLKEGDALYGKANCTAAKAVSAGTCAGGFCRANGNTLAPDPIDPSKTVSINPAVLIGSVPFVDLKIPADVALDGWNNKLTYAVTESQTDPGSFGRYKGAIQYRTFDRIKYAAGTAAAVKSQGNQNDHIALISHGADGGGAYNVNGVLVAACPIVGADVENCNNNAIFFDPLLEDPAAVGVPAGSGRVNGPFHYDDIVWEISDIPTSIWTSSTLSGHGSDIVSMQRIGIATNDVSVALKSDGTDDLVDQTVNGVTTKVKHYDNNIILDVNGNARIQDQAVVNQICDLSGSNCYTPSAIAGAGYITCETQSNNAMTGIAYSAANCGLSFPPGISKTCAKGHYVIGIKNGAVQCN